MSALSRSASHELAALPQAFDEHMHYQLGARLGPLVEITLEPPAIRTLSLSLGIVTKMDKRTRAALRLQRAFRVLQAKRVYSIKKKKSCSTHIMQPLSRACCWTAEQRKTAAQLKMLATDTNPLALGLLHDRVRAGAA